MEKKKNIIQKKKSYFKNTLILPKLKGLRG